MLEKWIKGIQHYPEDRFKESVLYECDRIFGDRLMETKHIDEYKEILNDAFRFSIGKVNGQYFIPSGAKTTQLQFNTEDQWKEIITRTIAITS